MTVPSASFIPQRVPKIARKPRTIPTITLAAVALLGPFSFEKVNSAVVSQITIMKQAVPKRPNMLDRFSINVIMLGHVLLFLV